MSQKYDEYLEKHRQAVKKAYQWIAAYIPELTDVETTRNIEFHDMSKNTTDEYTPYDNYFYGEQTPAIIEAFNRAWLMHIHRNPNTRSIVEEILEMIRTKLTEVENAEN